MYIVLTKTHVKLFPSFRSNILLWPLMSDDHEAHDVMKQSIIYASLINKNDESCEEAMLICFIGEK